MMWSPNYKKIEKTERIKSKHTIYSPIVIDNTLHIVKGVIKNLYKDMNDPYKDSEFMYQCDLNLNIKNRMFGLFYLTKKIEFKDTPTYCLSHDFLDCLIRTLSTYKKATNFIVSNELQKIIIENDLNSKLFDKGITCNTFPSKLILNKEVDLNKKYNKIINNVCVN